MKSGLEKLLESDRKYFLAHPTVESFKRRCFEGEFRDSVLSGLVSCVIVQQIRTGIRIRMPVLAKEAIHRKRKLKEFSLRACNNTPDKI